MRSWIINLKYSRNLSNWITLAFTISTNHVPKLCEKIIRSAGVVACGTNCTAGRAAWWPVVPTALREGHMSGLCGTVFWHAVCKTGLLSAKNDGKRFNCKENTAANIKLIKNSIYAYVFLGCYNNYTNLVQFIWKKLGWPIDMFVTYAVDSCDRPARWASSVQGNLLSLIRRFIVRSLGRNIGCTESF
jgi:hypothetical protein